MCIVILQAISTSLCPFCWSPFVAKRQLPPTSCMGRNFPNQKNTAIIFESIGLTTIWPQNSDWPKGWIVVGRGLDACSATINKSFVEISLNIERLSFPDCG